MLRYIAVLCNPALTTEKNDILNFLSSYFLSISWRNRNFFGLKIYAIVYDCSFIDIMQGCCFLILGHQTAVPFDVDTEDCCELSLKTFFCHKVLPQLWLQTKQLGIRMISTAILIIPQKGMNSSKIGHNCVGPINSKGDLLPSFHKHSRPILPYRIPKATYNVSCFFLTYKADSTIFVPLKNNILFLCAVGGDCEVSSRLARQTALMGPEPAASNRPPHPGRPSEAILQLLT